MISNDFVAAPLLLKWVQGWRDGVTLKMIYHRKAGKNAYAAVAVAGMNS